MKGLKVVILPQPIHQNTVKLVELLDSLLRLLEGQFERWISKPPTKTLERISDLKCHLELLKMFAKDDNWKAFTVAYQKRPLSKVMVKQCFYKEADATLVESAESLVENILEETVIWIKSHELQ